jgi:hypothetical protein
MDDEQNKDWQERKKHKKPHDATLQIASLFSKFISSIMF